MPKNPDFDWITADLLSAMIRESQEHESRVRFLRNAHLCWKYYNSNLSWISPDGLVIADPELDNGIPVSYENRIKQIVDAGVSVLLKNNPIVRHFPYAERPGDADIADDMDRRLYSLWDEGGAAIRRTLKTALLEAEVSGMSVLKVFWSVANKIKSEDGEVAVRKLVNEDVFLDPFATNDHMAQDCRYIAHRVWQLPEYIISKFGVDGEVALGLRDRRGRAKESTTSKLSKIWSKFANSYKPEEGYGGQEKSDSRVEVWEVWINNVTDESGELVSGVKIEEKDFPYGVVATMINDEIVQVIPNPNAEKRVVKEVDVYNTVQVETNRRVIVGSKTHPFVVWYWNPTADDNGCNGIYQCTGIVESLIPLQVSYNSLSTNIEINARTLANPSMVVMDGALRDLPTDRIMALPGAIYRVNPDFGVNINSAVQFAPGTQMPQFVDNMRMDKRQSMQEMSGILPAMVGLSPTGTSHLPAGTLAGLQEAAFGPLASPIRELETALYQISVLAEGLMQQYYKVGRFVEISSEGERRAIEWQTRHITANFIRRVVSGSTTPIADFEKESRLANVATIVESALQSGNPLSIQNVILYLQNIGNPYAYDWIQLLQTALAQMQVQMQQQALMQGLMLAQGSQGQEGAMVGTEAQGTPQPVDQETLSGLDELASAFGVDPQRLRAVVSAT